MTSTFPTYGPVDWLIQSPRRTLWLTTAVCVCLLAYGLYLQHAVGLEPCPMCIVQRYALLLVAMLSGATALAKAGLVRTVGLIAGVMVAGLGAFVAARQSWLQWYPPEVLSCGRDLYGMIEAFPLQRVIPLVFKGSGDCSAIDWTFLGLTIANWSFLSFSTIVAVCALLLVKRSAPAAP